MIAWALIFNGNNKNEVAEDNESDEGALGEYNFEVVEIPEESYVD